MTVTGSGDPKTRNKEAKAKQSIPFLMPQFQKPISSNMSAEQPKSPSSTFLVIVSAVSETFLDPVTTSLAI